MSKRTENLLEQALIRWKFASEAEQNQRSQEIDDLSFQIPDNQWIPAARDKRDKAGRPRVSISKIDQPIQRVLNQERSAHLGVNIHAISEDSSDDTAEVIQGLYRAIERDSVARQARRWAYHRGVLAGRGYWRVSKVYDEESGNPFDQKIVIEQIYYQNSVIFDPASTRQDRSDANYCFVESWVDEDTYKLEFGREEPVTALEFEDMNNRAPGWTEYRDGKRSFRIVEYWYKEVEKETIVLLKDGRAVAAKEAPEGKIMKHPRSGAPMRREKSVTKVKFAKISGRDVKDEQDWDGQYIPIIPFIARELQPFDGQRWAVGLINHSKDGQRFFNYAVSTYLERMGQEPKAPIVGYVGQFEGLEEEWDALNTENISRLEVNPVTDKATGAVLPLPQRMQIDLSGVSLAGQAMQVADGLIQSTTTVYDAGLGRLTEDTRKTSGRALLALQQESDVSTSDFMDQYSLAIAHEARVILDLLPYVYDRPGRVARILRGDSDKHETVMLNKPYTMQGGKPTPVNPEARPSLGQSLMTALGRGPAPQPAPLNYDLTKGRYGVEVKVGKSYATRLEHGAEFMQAVLEKMPQFLPILGDILFRYRDDPGAKEIADRLVKLREKTMPGLGETGPEGQMPPEQMQAALEAQKQQIEQMGMQMQMMAKELENDRLKHQTTLQKAQMDNTSRERESARDNQTAIIVAKIQAAIQQELKRLDVATKAASQGVEVTADTVARHEEMAHDASIEELKMGQEREARMEQFVMQRQQHRDQMAQQERFTERDRADRFEERQEGRMDAREDRESSRAEANAARAHDSFEANIQRGLDYAGSVADRQAAADDKDTDQRHELERGLLDSEPDTPKGGGQ